MEGCHPSSSLPEREHIAELSNTRTRRPAPLFDESEPRVAYVTRGQQACFTGLLYVTRMYLLAQIETLSAHPNAHACDTLLAAYANGVSNSLAAHSSGGSGKRSKTAVSWKSSRPSLCTTWFHAFSSRSMSRMARRRRCDYVGHGLCGLPAGLTSSL
jgi:hypothetical protein